MKGALSRITSYNVCYTKLLRSNYDPNNYKVGDSDIRPWGKWEVVGFYQKDGEDYVEKHITVTPTGILSLQSHKLRREKWTVLKGKLRVTLNDNIIDMSEGESSYNFV